jgi:hypothetical protein
MNTLQIAAGSSIKKLKVRERNQIIDDFVTIRPNLKDNRIVRKIKDLRQQGHLKEAYNLFLINESKLRTTTKRKLYYFLAKRR